MKHFFPDRLIFIKTCLNFILYQILIWFAFATVAEWEGYPTKDFIAGYYDLLFIFSGYSSLLLLFLYILLKPYRKFADLLVTRILTPKNLFHIIWQNFKINVILFTLVTALVLFTRVSYSRSVIGLLFIFYGLAAVALHIAFAYLMKSGRQREKYTLHLVIIGNNPISATIANLLWNNSRHNYQLAKDSIISENNLLSTRNKNSLPALIKNRPVDVILICSTLLKKINVDALVDFANQHFIKIQLVNHFAYTIVGNPLIRHLSDIPLINLNAFPLERFQNRFIKRLIDLIASGLVIITLLSWLTPLLAILLRLESKGGVFYRHPRTGRGGDKFYCLKFRSMYLNDGQTKKNPDDKKNLSRTGKPEKVAVENDERITPIGSFLRKRHIDELPQFINIFKGEMSLVGPRPHILDVDAYFHTKIPSFHFRYFVNPGITGLAQISYERERGIDEENVKILEQKIKLDKFYIHYWSLGLDIKIMFLTTKYIIWGDPKSI